MFSRETQAPFEGTTSGNRRTSRAFANRRRPSMTKQKKIVEVTVTNDGGEQVPVGIMNANQALSLPEEMDVSVSHPDRKAGATDELIGRDELRTLTEPWIEPVGIRFPAPISEDTADRFEEAKAAARNVLDEVIATAN